MQRNIDAVSPRTLSVSGVYKNQIKFYEPRKFDFTSRYGNSRQIMDLMGNMYFESFNSVSIKETSGDKYYTVSIKDENRLDIIANNCYGTKDYWWLIAFANDIIDPFSVERGRVLRIPPLSSMYIGSEVI